MPVAHSLVRAFCVDYLRIHKKKIAKKKNLRCIKILDVASLQKLLPEAEDIRDTDEVCQHCFTHLKEILSSSSDSRYICNFKRCIWKRQYT